MKLTYISDFSLALESLFGPDFDLVTSARFLPTSVLGKKKELCKLNVHQEELWDVKPLVLSLDVLLGGLKRTRTLLEKSRAVPVLWIVC